MDKPIDTIKNGKPFKLWDIAIYALVLIAIIVSLILIFQPTGSTVRVTINGTVVDELSLNIDCERTYAGASGSLIVEIKDGTAYIAESDCPEQICVKTGSISRVGSRIICIPNNAIIEILGTGGVEATT